MTGLAVSGPQTKSLRSYQIEAIERLRDSVRAGHRRPVLQAPVGAGKTLVAATIVQSALDKGNRVVFVVPAISLIDQTVEAFGTEGITEVGVMQANHPLTDSMQPVQIATIQTLMKRSEYPLANVVIWDECHRVWEFMGKWMTDPMWLRKPFIGLSATPWTKGLGRLFDDLIVVSTTEELIKAGYLSPFRVFAPSHPDLSGVRTVAGDYHEGELAEAMDRPPLTANVVDTWLKFAEGRPTLCFAVDRAHAKHLQHEFEDCGVPCGYQDMNTDPAERREIKRKFHSGEYKVVTSCETLIMGVDWDVRCISMCRPTKSEMLFCQAIGRGLRIAEGKRDLVILDHSDNHLRLGFITDIDANHTGLAGGKAAVRRDAPVPLPKECPQCNYLRPPRVSQCPNCGLKPTPAPPPKPAEGQLAELRPKPQKGLAKVVKRTVVLGKTPVPLADFYAGLLYYARSHGYRDGWAANKYKEAIGVWPNAYKHVAAEPPGMATASWIKSRQIAYAKGRERREATRYAAD